MTTDWPPSLTLETEPVLKLFTGENFYSSPDAAIREVVLNSIDAIGRRLDSQPDVDPNIELVFDRDKKTITVTDNGEGMNQKDLVDLFSKVGASAAQLSNSTNYRAVGEFGIGALSYFLVCDRYEIQTCRQGDAPVGLVYFKEMLDGKTRADETEARMNTVGTMVTMHINSPELLQLCIDKFQHWMRSVEGLSGQVLPEGQDLDQGGLTRKVRQIDLTESPDWIDGVELGPPEDLNIWDSYDGKGHVDVLYKGVFVERIEVEQLWGLEGAIHVDPKHFRPMLNREGFVGDTLKTEMTPFLQSMHPEVLEKAVECIHDLLAAKDDWSLNKAITLWLAVPRSGKYEHAATIWDAEFRDRKVFRLFRLTNETRASVADIISLGVDEIYLAPDKYDQSTPVIGQAIRVLRGRGSVIVQGLQRDDNYLSTVSMPAQFSSWLLLNTFKNELPNIIHVQNIAESTVGQDSLAEVYSAIPKVKLVELGSDSVPFLTVGDEIWINLEVEAGQNIVNEICKRNEGHLGLWVACMMHAPGEGRLDQVGNVLSRQQPKMERLGLVRRQYLRSFLK